MNLVRTTELQATSLSNMMCQWGKTAWAPHQLRILNIFIILKSLKYTLRDINMSEPGTENCANCDCCEDPCTKPNCAATCCNRQGPQRYVRIVNSSSSK